MTFRRIHLLDFLRSSASIVIVVFAMHSSLSYAMGTVGSVRGEKVYESMRWADDLGPVHLTETYARFENLHDRMRLRFVGTGSTGNFFNIPNLPPARVYRVENWQRYFERNRRHHRFCGRPIRWLGVAVTPAGLGEIDFYQSSSDPLSGPDIFATACLLAAYTLPSLHRSPAEQLRRLLLYGDYGPFGPHAPHAGEPSRQTSVPRPQCPDRRTRAPLVKCS
jgi:hypothetical protein